MKLRNKKTGKFGEYKVISAGFLIRVKDCNSDESWQYDCLAGFIEDWEDYKPAEPLIKDEKVRKAVRAWAEVEALVYVVVRTDYRIISVNDYSEIKFDEPVFNGLPKGRNLTITELCGGEEEPEDEGEEEE